MSTYPIPANATSVQIADPIFIISNPVNLPPTVSAGNDVSITLPANTVSLQGRGSDPEGKAVSFVWTQISGVGGSIMSPNSANTDVTNLTQGTYTFRLTVTDDQGAKTTDDVVVTVNPAPVIIPPSKYEGFGSQAIGGSNSSDKRTVKTEADFFANLGSNRTILFGANVTLKKTLYVTNYSFLTIDANGFDVTFDGINDDGISFEGPNAHNIILTGVRVKNCTGDGINVVAGAHDIVIDHCSSYSNGDGNLDCAADNSGKTFNVTFQNCFLGKGMAGWSGDTLDTGNKLSIHHCLYAPQGTGVAERCPYAHSNYSPVGSPNLDFRNNLIYNWGRYATGVGYFCTSNIVNNYYASNKSGAIDPNADPSGNTSSNHAWYYVSGNVQLGGADINLGGGNHAEYVIPDPYKITMTDAKTAAKNVLANCGTAVKDAYELSVINAITIQ